MIARRQFGAVVVVVFVSLAAYGQTNMTVTLDTTHLTIASGEPILRYHYADVPFKPYVQELYTPKGFNVLLDAPHDHLHHHALMFAIAAEDVNFWEETDTSGKQTHRGFTGASVDQSDGAARAMFSEAVDWVRPSDGLTLLNETRTIAAYGAPDLPATVITWVTALSAAPGLPSVTLSGSHYFGLGFRFTPSMDAIGTFRNAAGDLGKVERGEERLGRATWSCYSAEVDGKPVTVAMFDDPANARHPATWFTMPVGFAYMSATLDLKTEPLAIDAGETLTLRYGVAVWDAQPTDDEIEAMYQRWLKLPRENAEDGFPRTRE